MSKKERGFGLSCLTVLSPSGSHPPASTGRSPRSTPFPRLWGKSAHPIHFSWGQCNPLCLCTPSPGSCLRRGKPRAIAEVPAVTGVKSQALGQFRKPQNLPWSKLLKMLLKQCCLMMPGQAPLTHSCPEFVRPLHQLRPLEILHTNKIPTNLHPRWGVSGSCCYRNPLPSPGSRLQR